MRPEDVEKLLAGYAAGTLDEAERRVLMRAALERQELFDALVEEDALKELLEDPRCRRQLLELLGAPSRPLWQRAWDWLRQPARIAAVASATAALVLVSAFVLQVLRREPVAPLAPAPVLAPQVAPTPASPEAASRGRPAAPATSDAKARPRRVTRAKRRPLTGGPPAPEIAEQAATVAPPAEAESAGAGKGAVALQEKAGPPGFAAALRVADEVLPAAALRVRLLRNGMEVTTDEEFAVRDALVLRVESVQPGRIWLYRRTGDGVLQTLDAAGAEGRAITPGTPLDLPLPAREQPGDEHVVVVLTPEAAAPAHRTGLRERGVRMAETPVPVRPLATVPLTLKFR